MKAWWFAGACVTAAVGAPALAQQSSPSALASMDAARVLQNVEAFYNRTNDFEADFTQTFVDALTRRPDHRAGHVRFKKPGRMLWEYTTPPGDVIVSDGTTIGAYEAASRQMFRHSMRGTLAPAGLSFLTGSGSLTRDFTLHLLDPTHARYPNFFVIQLEPTQPNPNYRFVVFFVEPSSFQVTTTELVDSQQNETRFDFVSPRVNTGIADAVFQWQPPPGATIVP